MRKLEDLTVHDYLVIVRRRIWYVAVISIIVGVGAVAYIREMPYIYESETTIAVSDRFIPVEYIESLDRDSPLERIDFVRQQLQNRTFLRRMVREFQLAPADRPIDAALQTVSGNVRVTMLTADTFILAYRSLDPAQAQAVTRRLAEALIELNESDRNDDVMLVNEYLEEEVSGAEATMAKAEEDLWNFLNLQFPNIATNEAALASELVTLENELGIVNDQLREARTVRASLDQRVIEQRQLREAVRNVGVPTAGTVEASDTLGATPVEVPSELASLLSELEAKRQELSAASLRYTDRYPTLVRLRSEVAELEQRAADARNEVQPSTGGDERISESDQDAAPQSFAPALPNVVASTEVMLAEIRLRVQETTAEIVELEAEREGVRRRIERIQARLNPPPAIARQLNLLTRDYEIAREQYQLMSTRQRNAEMAARVDASEENAAFRVVDPAYLPLFPVAPDKRLLAMAAVLAAALLGVAAAFVREFLDASLHDEAEVMAELDMPVLASIPSVAALPKAKRDLLRQRPLTVAPSPTPSVGQGEFAIEDVDERISQVLTQGAGIAGESFKLMHARLASLKKRSGVTTVLIASAIPGEGKTYAACCLAGMLAREHGKRVLLVDADLRTGSATKLLGLTGDRTGLDDLLRTGRLGRQVRDSPNKLREDGAAPARELEDAILRCAALNLYVLPAGPLADPAELLNTPELERVLQRAQELFDWVVIDSPAVLAVADANLISPLCDATVFVVRSGATSSTIVKEAIQRLGRDRIHGILMNRVHQGNTSSNHYYTYEAQRSAARIATD